MAFLMAEVKRKTDQWELHDILSEFDPQSYALVDDGHRQVNSEENHLPEIGGGGFQTALQLSQKQKSENISREDKTIPATKDIASYFDIIKNNESCIGKENHKDDILIEERETLPEKDGSYLFTCNSNDGTDKSSSPPLDCKMKEPNKIRDRENEVKHDSSQNKKDAKTHSNDDHKKHSRSSEHKSSHKSRSSKHKSSRNSSSTESSHKEGKEANSHKDTDETELEKAMRRIKELEESNKILAKRRIKELEEENKILNESEGIKHCSKKENPGQSKLLHREKSTTVKPSLISGPDRKRKQSTASSSSTTSMKSPSFKSGAVQNKLKLLGLSDSGGSSEEDNEEDQKTEFQNLFGATSTTITKTLKSKTHSKNSKTTSTKREKETSSATKPKKPHAISDSDRDSSSSPNLSDIEERIKVEKEVRQIIADEEESEKEALFIDSNTSEHDQLAAWLGKYS